MGMQYLLQSQSGTGAEIPSGKEVLKLLTDVHASRTSGGQDMSHQRI